MSFCLGLPLPLFPSTFLPLSPSVESCLLECVHCNPVLLPSSNYIHTVNYFFQTFRTLWNIFWKIYRVYMYMCVCVIYVYVCLYVCMHVYVCVCMYVCVMCMYAYVCVCMCV